MMREGASERKVWKVVIGERPQLVGCGVTRSEALTRAVLAAEQLGWPERYTPEEPPPQASMAGGI
jgi:hypothetical protein